MLDIQPADQAVINRTTERGSSPDIRPEISQDLPREVIVKAKTLNTRKPMDNSPLTSKRMQIHKQVSARYSSKGASPIRGAVRKTNTQTSQRGKRLSANIDLIV